MPDKRPVRLPWKFIKTSKNLRAQLEKIDDKMSGECGFQSVEWCDSLDSTEVRVRESLEAFNDSIVTA